MAFVPWVAFGVLAQHSTLKLAAIGGLIASLVIAARSMRFGSVKVLELGTVLAFGGFAAVAFGVDGSGQHGPDEYADLTTVVPYYQALREFLGGSPG